MKSAVCVNSACERTHFASEEFLRLANGLCRRCAASEDSVARTCAECGREFREYPRFLRKIGAFAGTRVRCPACHDRKVGKLDVHVAESRECLAYFPLVRVMGLDMTQAELCPKGGSGRPPRTTTLKAGAGRQGYEGQLTVYDYREDGSRGPGSIACVRVMKVRHAAGHMLQVMSGELGGPKASEVLEFSPDFEYLVLEDPEAVHLGQTPEADLICADWSSTTRREGGIARNEAHWSRLLTWQSRSGTSSSGLVVAIVDREHAITIKQDNIELRFASGFPELDVVRFRDDVQRGPLRVTYVVPEADSALIGELDSQGFHARTIETGGVVVTPRRSNDGLFEMPNLPGGVIQLVDCEVGGEYANGSGWAAAVASLSGQPLVPTSTREPLWWDTNGSHAWFAESDGILVAQACCMAECAPVIQITRHLWVPGETENVGRVSSDVIFEGAPTEVPAGYSELAAAVLTKARTPNCRRPVFRSS